jgi:hypothetical protein
MFLLDVSSLVHFVPMTFCPSGRFVPLDVLSLRMFEKKGKEKLGMRKKGNLS